MYFSPSAAITGEVERPADSERFSGVENVLPLLIEEERNISPLPVFSSTHTILIYDSSIAIRGEVEFPVLIDILRGEGRKYLPYVDLFTHISPVSNHTTYTIPFSAVPISGQDGEE